MPHGRFTNTAKKMTLKDIHKTLEEIPEEYRSLYTEKGDHFELTGIQGVKTQADVDRVAESLRKEKSDHGETKTKLRIWGEMDHEETVKKLDRIGELEAAAGGKLDEAKIEEIVGRRVAGTIASQTAPLERQITTLTTERDEFKSANEGLVSTANGRSISDAMREAMSKLNVLSVAHADALMFAGHAMEIRADDGAIVTKSGIPGVNAGLNPEQFLLDVQPSRPHWWEDSKGGGSKGSGPGGLGAGAKNPWGEEGWNVTNQARYAKEHGMDKAKAMASAANSSIGATAATSKK